tara:strand:- start:6622 stop:7230 length:609 start_codon:yes stop_codon:yes gene_type:complete
MPNHCSNQLHVSGKRSRVFDFCRDHYSIPEKWHHEEDRAEHKVVLDFSVSVPYPKDSAQRLDKEGWYDWNVRNWGTKWGAYDLQPETFPEVLQAVKENKEKDVGSASYSFSTAWAPPIEWMGTASLSYPELTFTLGYFEPGMDFAGVVSIQNGKVLYEQEFRPSDQCTSDAWTEATADDWVEAEYATWQKVEETIATCLPPL